MTAISVITVLACLIVGALTIRYGNLTLREQQKEVRQRSRPKKQVMADAVDKQEIEMAMRDLARWRNQGYLKATEASWKKLEEMSTENPRAVLSLRGIVERQYEQSKDLPPGKEKADSVRIILAGEEYGYFWDDLKRKRNHEPKEPDSTLMVQTPLAAS